MGVYEIDKRLAATYVFDTGLWELTNCSFGREKL